MRCQILSGQETIPFGFLEIGEIEQEVRMG